MGEERVWFQYLNRGRKLHEKKEFKEAEENKRKALEICLHAHGGTTSHKDIAECYHSLGITLHALKKYSEAEECKRKALDMKIDLYGKTANNPDISVSYVNLGLTLHVLGRYADAEHSYRKALEMRKILYGETANNADIAYALHGLGQALHALSRYSEAQDYLKQALDMYIAVHGTSANHIEIALSYYSLGLTLLQLSKLTKAETALRKALEMRITVYGEAASNTELADSYHQLGVALHACSRHHEAEKHLRKAIHMRQALFGITSSNIDVAASYHYLGETLCALNRQSESEEFLKKALDIRVAQNDNGVLNADIANTLHSLGVTTHALNKYEEAEKHFRDATDMRQKLYSASPNHPLIAQSFRALGITLRAVGRDSEAKEYEDIALKIEQTEANSTTFSNENGILDTNYCDKGYIRSRFRSCDAKMKSLYNSPKVYSMSKVTKGRCLIINNKTFLRDGKLDIRKGSDIDVTNLANLFIKLGFDTIIKLDITGQNFAKEVKTEIDNTKHENFGIFVLVIMTHGDAGILYGSDNESVKRHDVIAQLYESESLRGKAKLIIMQACAGDSQIAQKCSTALCDEHDDPSDGPRPCNPKLKISQPPDDVFFVASSFEGFVSVREPERGSPFIRALTEGLYEHAHQWHLEKIVKKVKLKLSKGGYPPLTYDSFLLKKLYFFPNYDEEPIV